MNKFVRKTTMFQGGSLTGLSAFGVTRGCTVTLPEQPVKIIREIPDNGNEDDEDRFEVEFYNMGRTIVDGCDLHPHPHAKATNAEFMAWLVEDCSRNPLMQGFVPEAVAKYAEMCLAKPEQFEDKPGEVSMVNGKAWLGVAKEALDAINANYRG